MYVADLSGTQLLRPRKVPQEAGAGVRLLEAHELSEKLIFMTLKVRESPMQMISFSSFDFARLFRKSLLLALPAVLLLLTLNAGATISLSSCKDITASGAYVLTQNVSSSGTCFFIDADNVSLNLNGHTVTFGTGGGSRPTPGVLIADSWYTGYNLAKSSTTTRHANAEVYGGSIIGASNAAPRSPAVWIGQSNDMDNVKIHDLTLKTYTTDSSPIFGTFTASGLQIYNNYVYYLASNISNRYEFFGVAIWIGDSHQVSHTVADQIHNNHIYAAPQGGIRDNNQGTKIYSNDITFNSRYTNDFCVDSPADNQEISYNNCHPNSGRGVHINSRNTYVHDNTITVQELSQNMEYGGCEIQGAYGVQVEFDPEVNSAYPTGNRVVNNQIHANAGACDAIGLRLTSITDQASITFSGNTVTTTNSGGIGHDYAISFSATQLFGSTVQFSNNTFTSKHAYVTSDWAGAYATINSGQHWYGTPQYSIDNENGANDGGTSFSQSLTLHDAAPGPIHCGSNARGYNNTASLSKYCNNLGGNPI